MREIISVFKDFLDTNIFRNESKQFEILLYKAKAAERASLAKAGQCMYFGCTNKSVDRSHGITKEGFLRAISENGVLLHPEFEIATRKWIPSEVGLSEASTFPGFCSKHEAFFQDFESEKEFKTISQVQKQIFRTICWELKEIDGNIKAQKKFFSTYAQRRNEIFYTYLSNNHLEFKHIDFSILSQHDKFLSSWSNFEKDLSPKKTFLKKMYVAIEKDLRKNRKANVGIIVLGESISYPVALSGFCHIKTPKEKHELKLILLTIPNQNSTLISLAFLRKDERKVQSYLQSMLATFSYKELVQHWMFHHTEKWYLKPSTWKNLEKSIKEKYISIMNTRDSVVFEVVNEPHLHIF